VGQRNFMNVKKKDVQLMLAVLKKQK
jgi:hypothetical protein